MDLILLKLVKERNKKEVYPFKDLILSHNNLLRKNRKLEKENLELKEEILKIKNGISSEGIISKPKEFNINILEVDYFN